MSGLNILLLNSSSIFGGGEYFVWKLSINLKKKGHNVTVGCRDSGMLYNKCCENGINVKHFNFPPGGTRGLIKNIRDIKKFIKENNIHLIHTNTNYDRTAGAFASMGIKANHVTSCHSLESIQHNITHFVRNRFLTKHFICDGSTIQNLIITENHIPAVNTTIVHNGINPDEMKRDPELRKKIRKEFGIADNEILIGNTGRMVRFKGQRLLIAAFKSVADHKDNVKLMIVGDGELKLELIEYSRILKLDDRIIFAGFREDLMAVYSAFDIYSHTSIEGGGELFPFSVLYALAQGLPVVATGTGDLPVMVVNEINGFVTEDESPVKISRKLLELIENDNLRKEFGTAGLKHLSANFTLEKMTESIEKVYENSS
jgi:glycosyltransferase involved in cell wall biosynthesis